MILVIAEQRGGILNRASWEAIAAAQQVAAGQPIAVVVPGGDAASAAEDVRAAAVQEVVEARARGPRRVHGGRVRAGTGGVRDRLLAGSRAPAAHVPGA